MAQTIRLKNPQADETLVLHLCEFTDLDLEMDRFKVSRVTREPGVRFSLGVAASMLMELIGKSLDYRPYGFTLGVRGSLEIFTVGNRLWD